MGRTGDSWDDAFPHEVGDEAFHRVDPVDGRKRGGPWARWLLNLIISLNLSISLINNYC